MHMPRALKRKQIVGGIALAALVVAIGVVFLLQRGGGSDAAHPLAQSSPVSGSVLSAAKLPGSGWTSSDTELVALFDSPDPVFPQTPGIPECSSVKAFESALYADEAVFTGGVGRVFERPLDGGGIARVTELAVSFSEPAAVDRIIAQAKLAIGGPELSQCMLAALSREGVTAAVEEAPAIPVPSSGVSRTLQFKDAASGSATVKQAIACWRDGDRLLFLTIAVAGEGLSAADIGAIGQAATGAVR
jgi:hypothetical protein